jgi:branched-chain amino acid transport system substrate-binding protein
MVAVLVLGLIPFVSQAAEPYEINVIIPLSGSGTFLGHAWQEAFESLEADVNETGGIQGRPLHFNIQDDQSTPAMALQLATALVQKNVPVILGSGLVSLCNAEIPLVKNGPLLYCLSPGVHPADGSFVFSTNVSTFDVIAVSTRYFRQRGWTRVAELTSTDASGQDAERAIDAALALPENKAMSLVAREHFNPADVSVAAQVERIKATNPQAIFAWTTGTPFGTILRALRDAGLDIPVVTTNGNMTDSQMTQYAQMLPSGLYFPGVAAVVPDAVRDRGVLDAVTTYRDALSAHGYKPEYIPVTGYDPGLLVVAALRKLGPSATAEQLRQYLSNLRGFAGATGRYDFRAVPQRGLGPDAVIMVRWDKSKGGPVAVSTFGGTPAK